jgi:hypothetical protein
MAVSGQLESHHFLRTGDSVLSVDGRRGTVVDGAALYAVVEWEDRTVQEVEQFDPGISVVLRAER